MTTEIAWIETHKQAPVDGQIVVVHGGVAQFRNHEFYTGMEAPQYLRPIKWVVTHWAYLSALNPTCRDAELKRQQDGPGADYEPDMNAESGRDRQIKEYEEKYR